MRRIAALILIWCLACLPLQAQEASRPIAALSSAETDAQIATRLRDILGELGETYTDVTVVVSDGVVTFRGTTETTADAGDLTTLANRLNDVVAVRNEVTETADIARRLDPVWDRFLARIDQLLIKLPLLLIAAVLFAVVVFIGIAVARMRWPWDGLAPNAFIANIYRQLVRLTFVVLGLILALDVLNAVALLSTILGAAGIIGLAIGFAVRDTVENFIASVLLSFRQPFRPNDTIEINGDQGKVIRLTSRATILLSFDGNHIRIPNSTVFKSRIVNFSKNAERRFKFDLLIDSDADLGATKNLVTQTVSDLPFVILAPPVSVWIDRLEPAGATITTTGWIDQNETSLLLAQSEAIRMVKAALQAAGISLVDATQLIQLIRDKEDQGNTEVPLDTSNVSLDDEAALDSMIQAERTEEEVENLLHDDGQAE